jgi:hypothetical protein
MLKVSVYAGVYANFQWGHIADYHFIYSLVFAIGISIWAYLNSPEDKN